MLTGCLKSDEFGRFAIDKLFCFDSSSDWLTLQHPVPGMCDFEIQGAGALRMGYGSKIRLPLGILIPEDTVVGFLVSI